MRDKMVSALALIISGFSTSVLEVHTLDADAVSSKLSFSGLWAISTLMNLSGSFLISWMQLQHNKDPTFNNPLVLSEICSVTFRTFENILFLCLPLGSWQYLVLSMISQYELKVISCNIKIKLTKIVVKTTKMKFRW